MRRAAAISSLILLSLIGWGTGIVGIHYPKQFDNQPLRNPLKIVSVDGSVITLEDDRTIEFPVMACEVSWETLARQANYLVEVESVPDGRGQVHVWFSVPDPIPATRWKEPIRIPLIADFIPANRRELFGIGSNLREYAMEGIMPLR
jgi:hypothetical protein